MCFIKNDFVLEYVTKNEIGFSQEIKTDERIGEKHTETTLEQN